MSNEIDTRGPTTIVAPYGMQLVVNGLVLHGRSSYEAQPGDTVSVIRVPTARTPLRELAQAYLAREAAKANLDSDTDAYWDASDAEDKAANALLAVLPEGDLDVICRAILAALDAERLSVLTSVRGDIRHEMDEMAAPEDDDYTEYDAAERAFMRCERIIGRHQQRARGERVDDLPPWHGPGAPKPLSARSGSGTEAARGASVDNASETETP